MKSLKILESWIITIEEREIIETEHGKILMISALERLRKTQLFNILMNLNALRRISSIN